MERKVEVETFSKFGFAALMCSLMFLAFMLVNLKAGSAFLKNLTFGLMVLFTLGAAGFAIAACVSIVTQ